MIQFFVASVVSYVILFLSKLVLKKTITHYNDDAKLKHSFVFNLAGVLLLISFLTYYVSITVLLAIVVRKLFL